MLQTQDLCSVKREDFDEIFDDFFLVRNLAQSDLNSKIDVTSAYNNYEIKKVEIKKGLDYSDFLESLLQKFNSYFYDGNREELKGTIHQSKAYEWVNNYTPKTGMLLNDFKEEVFGGKKGEDFIKDDKLVDLSKEEKKMVVDYLKTSEIANVLELEKGEKYILLSKHNKISIQSESKILGYLHGDIGEFILYFFVEGFLKSPILFSKIRHSKSSGADKIKGTDGIHFLVENNEPKFLFLESKFKKEFSGCVDETVSSQIELLKNDGEGDINNELHILEGKGPLIDKDFGLFFENGFEKFIDPYYTGETNQNDLPFDLVSGLIYEHDTGNFIEDETLGRICMLLQKYKDMETLLGGRKITIFLLPLLNNEEMIKQFLDKTKT